MAYPLFLNLKHKNRLSGFYVLNLKLIMIYDGGQQQDLINLNLK